jgi:hypothetical protein
VLQVQRPAPLPERPLEQRAEPQEAAVAPQVVRARAPAVAREPGLPVVGPAVVPAPVVARALGVVPVMAEQAPALRRALAAAPPSAA